jgi:ferredoxin
VAKLKSHMQAMYTGAIKNFYGAIPAKQRKEIHGLGRYVPFSEGIVDVFQAARPAFGIIDGIVGMEGRGPAMGNPRQLGILMASSDLVALDRVAVNVVGWERIEVHHITEAAARGLGEGDIGRITVTGELLDGVRVRFVPPPTAFRSVPGFLLNAFYNFWSIKPEMIKEKCIACGTCVDACPVSAITLDREGKAVVDYGKCVECFCCHELCVYGAVSERPSALKQVLSPVKRSLFQTKER